MPTYAYEALNAAGKPQQGTVEATSSKEAVQRIKSDGFFPTSVREQKVKGDGRVRGVGLSTRPTGRWPTPGSPMPLRGSLQNARKRL